MKFGGTSVGGARPIERVTGLIERYHREGLSLVVVVSAIRGVTNNLVRACQLIEGRNESSLELVLEDLLYRHMDVITDLNSPNPLQQTLEDDIMHLFSELQAEATKPATLTPERSDKILSFGERFNTRIVSSKVLARGLRTEVIDATNIIETDSHFGEAVPNLEKTKVYAERVLKPMLEEGVIPVVTGFIGATKDGKTTTLGRGGSDYTASILGKVLSAGSVWIWTDVNGLYSSDPRHNPDAQLLSELSQLQANKMVAQGIQVLYPKTLLPLLETDTVLYIKNTFNPDAEGTKITYR